MFVDGREYLRLVFPVQTHWLSEGPYSGRPDSILPPAVLSSHSQLSPSDAICSAALSFHLNTAKFSEDLFVDLDYCSDCDALRYERRRNPHKEQRGCVRVCVIGGYYLLSLWV